MVDVGSLNEFIRLRVPLVAKGRVHSEGSTVPTAVSLPTRRKVFDLKELLKNTENDELVKVVRSHNQLQLKNNRQKNKKSQSPENTIRRLHKTEHSFFADKNANYEALDRKTLNKRHQLQKCIVRTQQQRNKFMGSSLVQQSYHRIVDGLGKIQIRAVTNKEQIQLGDNYMKLESIKTINKEYQAIKTGMLPKHRLRLETCRSWAKKHKKNTGWYCKQLSQSRENSQQKSPIRTGRDHVFGSIKQLLKRK